MTTELEKLAGPETIARREERSPTNWIATIRLRDGTEIPCTVKDVSKSGAKIGVAASQALPPIFMLRIIGRDFLCLVHLAWRRGDHAGVRIERVGKVPGAGSTRSAEPSRQSRSSDSDARPIENGGLGVPSRKRGISAF